MKNRATRIRVTEGETVESTLNKIKDGKFSVTAPDSSLEEGPKWRSKTKGDILIQDMDEKYLQDALIYAQKRELYFHNSACTFAKKSDELREEAEKRGITLLELDQVHEMGSYFENTRMLKSKMSKNIK